jgi:uncharacterized lipoprotein YajG
MKKIVFILAMSLGLLSCNNSSESITITQDSTQTTLDSSCVDTTCVDTTCVDSLKK